MGLTVALVATLALAASAEDPQDAAGWRARSDALYAQGEFRAALEAAGRARLLDPADPWASYAHLRALAAFDADAARREISTAPDPAALKSLPEEDRAKLETALGYLCLDLGIESRASTYFEDVPVSASSHSKAQAGLAILAVRRGNSRQALEHFSAARATVRQDPSLAELERDARYDVVLKEFATARDLRDANAAGRAYAVLDELRPNHPATLQARADLAYLRGDMAARERALRALLAVDPKAPGAANQLVDTLLALGRPYDAFRVARKQAPERLASDLALQAIEREYVPHFEAALDGRLREGQVEHDRFALPRFQLAWSGSVRGWGRLRVLASGQWPESDDVPAGEPYGSFEALPATFASPSDEGIGGLVQWAPWDGFALELGTTPTSFEVSNLIGALRYRSESEAGEFVAGVDRSAVEDSLLSYAGSVDPLDGRAWGGVVRERGYLGGRLRSGEFGIYGFIAGAALDGERVDSNTEWRADAGFTKLAASGGNWVAHVGGAFELLGMDDNRSHFTLGHGGYFSPEHFLSVGPVFDIQGHGDNRSFRIEGGVLWQEVREDSSPYFPTDDALQAASGNPRYAGNARDGIGVRISASLEWRMTDRTVAGLRLEGVRGEDADEVRLQIYTRRWDHRVSDPVERPPVPFRSTGHYALN